MLLYVPWALITLCLKITKLFIQLKKLIMTTINNNYTKVHSINNYEFTSIKTQQYQYSPALKGEMVPSVFFQKQNILAKYLVYGSLVNEQIISLQDFLDYQHPIVLAFYSGNAALPNIAELESLQSDIEVMGGKLILVVNDAARHFKRAIKENSGLTVYYDRDNVIAEQFGLHDEFNPLWHWVSGVEQSETVLPALYVIAPDKQIVYSHIDYDLQLFSHGADLSENQLRELLSTVYQTHQQYSYPLQKRQIV
jgi:hypothetical protein